MQNLDKVNVKSRDILDVSIAEFDKKLKYSLTPTPTRAYSEKIFALNPVSSKARIEMTYELTEAKPKNRLKQNKRRTVLDKISRQINNSFG